MHDISRHEIIDISLVQKNAIRQRLKGIILLQKKYFTFNMLNKPFFLLHLCPGLNAVTNVASFTIFCFSFKFNKFCDFSLNSTRYTKICCLNDFSVRCAEIYNFMLTDQQAPACRFYKIYDFLLTSRFFNKPLRNLQFFAFLCNANSSY